MGEFKCAFLYGKPHRFEAFKWHEEENRAKKERKTGDEKKSKETRERRRGNKEKKTKVHFNFSPFLELFLKFYYSFSFLFIYSYFLILFRPVLHFAFRPSLSRKTS